MGQCYSSCRWFPLPPSPRVVPLLQLLHAHTATAHARTTERHSTSTHSTAHGLALILDGTPVRLSGLWILANLNNKKANPAFFELIETRPLIWGMF